MSFPHKEQINANVPLTNENHSVLHLFEVLKKTLKKKNGYVFDKINGSNVIDNLVLRRHFGGMSANHFKDALNFVNSLLTGKISAVTITYLREKENKSRIKLFGVTLSPIHEVISFHEFGHHFNWCNYNQKCEIRREYWIIHKDYVIDCELFGFINYSEGSFKIENKKIASTFVLQTSPKETLIRQTLEDKTYRKIILK